MHDMSVSVAIAAITLIAMPVSLGLVLWLLVRLRRKSDRPLSTDMAGAIVVPVRQLRRTFGFFGQTKNGISPRLTIAGDGLYFKIFKIDHWAFGAIAEIDAPRVPFVTRLSIRNRSGDRLYVDLAGTARARAFLQALPETMPLTPRAVKMRNDGE